MAGLRLRRMYDGSEARVDRPWERVPHGQPPLQPPDFRFPLPKWLLPRPPPGTLPPNRPPPDTRVPPHLLSWENIVQWPPPGSSRKESETLWHRDKDDRVPNEGEDEQEEHVFYSEYYDDGYYEDDRYEEDVHEDSDAHEPSDRFELNHLWLERFAKSEIERKQRDKERRKEQRREERIVVPAAVEAAARVDAAIATRREAEARGKEGVSGSNGNSSGAWDHEGGVDESNPSAVVDGTLKSVQ